MLIKRGGIYRETTETKYKKQFKQLGFEIVEENKVQDVKESSIDELGYRELQSLAQEHDITANQKKDDLISELKKVL